MAALGLPVTREHCDEDISGGEFGKRRNRQGVEESKRPGFAAIMEGLRDTGALVAMEPSRFARDLPEYMNFLRLVKYANVRLFYYLDAREVNLHDDMAMMMEAMHAFAASQEKKRASARQKDSRSARLPQGKHLGGRTYGYLNVRTGDRVTQQPDPATQPTIVKVFTLATEGYGYGGIARTLEAECIPNPSGGSQWTKDTVRGLLHNEKYRGVLVDGVTARDWSDATCKVVRRDAPTYRAERPDLRIVSDDLWNAAHEKLGKRRDYYMRNAGGHLDGRPEDAAPYLLTRYLRCGQCGAPVLVKHRRAYKCSRRVQHGETACANNMNVSLASMDRPVIEALLGMLSVETIESAIDQAVARYRADGAEIEAEKSRVASDLESVKAEIARTGSLVIKGLMAEDDAAPILRDAQARKQTLAAKLEHLDGQCIAAPVDREALRAAITGRIDDWRNRLRQEPAIARQIIARVVSGWIETDGQAFRGVASFGRVMSGVIESGSNCVYPKGGEAPLRVSR